MALLPGCRNRQWDPERGPRQSLANAVKLGLIASDEVEIWSEMLSEKNLVAHTYRAEWARESVEKIAGAYLPQLEDVAGKVRMRM